MAVNPLSSWHMISSTLTEFACKQKSLENLAGPCMHVCPLSQNNEGFVNKMLLHHTFLTESKNKILCHCTIQS